MIFADDRFALTGVGRKLDRAAKAKACRWNFHAEEAEGLALFNDPLKGNCAACHPTANFDVKTPSVFTDFSFDNLGIPKNPDNPFYE